MIALFIPRSLHYFLFFFFFNDTATTEIYTLSLHDALPILRAEKFSRHLEENAIFSPARSSGAIRISFDLKRRKRSSALRSEEHTSELQSQSNLVCRLLLEKKKNKKTNYNRQ